jgi:hypothetical protein
MKMKSTTVALFTAALLAVAATSWPVQAIDAWEVMEKMESRERSGFLAGAVDMAAHIYAVNGNKKKADCAVMWYFDDKNSLREIYAFYEQHKNKDAVGLLAFLIDRKCGK